MRPTQRMSQGGKATPKDLSLGLKLKNFGPISIGQIDLKPVTILIGPNNAGKSYAAMLIHSLLDTLSFPGPFEAMIPAQLNWHLWRRLERPSQELVSATSALRDHLPALRDKRQVELSLEESESLVERVVRDMFEHRLTERIAYSFGSRVDELERIGRKPFELQVHTPSLTVTLELQRRRKQLAIKVYRTVLRKKITIHLTDSSSFLFKPEIADDEFTFLLGMAGSDTGIRDDVIARLPELVFDSISRMVSSTPSIPLYLPAARAAIVHGTRGLLASIVERGRMTGEDVYRSPKTSGVTQDLLLALTDLPREEGPLADLARDFEKSSIDGELVIPSKNGMPHPEIRYKFRNAEISLYRASSAVSELAPLILYLKFYIRQGSVLIIEEPEAHLHPANIMTLARFLVRLRRHGVNLVLTTHSEYLLEQLGNFIRLEKVAPDVRVSNYHYDRNDFLKADEVAVHMFKPDKKRGGFTIAALEVSPEEGISAEAFMEVHESLYDETVRLERDLMKVTGGRGDQ